MSSPTPIPLWKSRPGAPYPATFGTQPINDFIHLSEGLSNSFLITTKEGSIVVNTGMFFEAPYHKQNYAKIDPSPPRYIVLTQGHVDHVGGVDHLRGPGTQVIAHAGNAEHQAYDRRLAPFRGARSAFAFKRDNARAVKQALADHGTLPPQAIPTPDIGFDGRFTFQLGGLRVELIGVKGAETNDSLVIWLPDHGICFPGNLFSCLFGHFPNLVTVRGDRYRDALTCAAAFELVRDLKPKLLLVGHHQPIAGEALIRSEIERIRDATLWVHDETVKGMNAGKDLHTLLREVVLPPHLEVGEGYGTVRWSVQAIWEHYAGWFHQESTTELYAVPRRAVHADLVELAGGPAALVDRARAKLAAGRHAEAIHLLDVVLSEPRPPASAFEVAIAVHRALAKESVNFWLSAWLAEQIDRLEARAKQS
jgi:alkyl sulfatase BDS1-like metallo-beta-lactamase superfamily hydrolase